MAVTLTKKLKLSIGSLVTASIQAAKNIKAKEAARIEADFQQAIADGTMSYDAQVKFLQDQLETEKKSSLIDQDVITDIKKAIGERKRLGTFDRYNERYSVSYGDLQSGKINAKDQLAFLERELRSTTNQDVMSELLKEIPKAKTAIRDYNNAIVSNQIQKAKYDGTQRILSGVIATVSDKKANALIQGNEDEASYYDAELTALKSQLSASQINDSINDMEIEAGINNSTATEKMDMLRREISNADMTTPMKYGDRFYDSPQEFWNDYQNRYLSGNGEGQFTNYFAEMSADYTKKVSNAKATSGTVFPAMDAIKQEVKDLHERPEMQAYTDKLNDLETDSLSSAFGQVAGDMLAGAEFREDYKNTEADLMKIANRYGLDTQIERMKLGAIVEQKFAEKQRKAESALQEVEIAKKQELSPEYIAGRKAEAERLSQEHTEFTKAFETVAEPETFEAPVIPTEPLIPYGEFVKRGDTIFSKAGKGYKTEQGLAKDLGLKPEEIDWDKIQPEKKTIQEQQVKTQEVKPEPVATKPATGVTPTGQKTFVVKQGDTLSQIAKNLYGDPNRWKELKTQEGKSFTEETAKTLQVGTKLTY